MTTFEDFDCVAAELRTISLFDTYSESPFVDSYLTYVLWCIKRLEYRRTILKYEEFNHLEANEDVLHAIETLHIAKKMLNRACNNPTRPNLVIPSYPTREQFRIKLKKN
jgi:hypothetical protein